MRLPGSFPSSFFFFFFTSFLARVPGEARGGQAQTNADAHSPSILGRAEKESAEIAE